MLYYAKSTGGFYSAFIHGAAIPVDAVEITEEEHSALLDAQSSGCIIQAGQDGRPVAVPRPEPSLGERRILLCESIDRAADAARLAVAGDPLRAAEYQVAEAEAKAYQAAGYAGDCPPSVRSWAEAKNWTGKQAADNIIAEAAAWNGALYAIRDARLKAKEGVRSALTADAAAALAQAAIDGINAKVANLGNAAS